MGNGFLHCCILKEEQSSFSHNFDKFQLRRISWTMYTQTILLLIIKIFLQIRRDTALKWTMFIIISFRIKLHRESISIFNLNVLCINTKIGFNRQNVFMWTGFLCLSTETMNPTVPQKANHLFSIWVTVGFSERSLLYEFSYSYRLAYTIELPFGARLNCSKVVIFCPYPIISGLMKKKVHSCYSIPFKLHNPAMCMKLRVF
jgi:hypothetical protein